MIKRWKIKHNSFLRFMFYFFIFTISYLPFLNINASASVIGNIEIKGLYSIDREELLYLLDFEPGKRIDEELIRLGIKRAFLKGIFEDISVETSDDENTDVFINVMERNFVEKISIEGNHALSKKKIKELFVLKKNQVLLCDMLEKAVEKLQQELARRGFPDATVQAETIQLKKPNRVKILLTINTCAPLIIQTIQTDDETKNAMKLSEGDIFNEIILEEDIERIKKYYKKNKYFNPQIGQFKFIDGRLEIPVFPGKLLNINIVDNHAISTKKLLREMPFFELESFDDGLVQEAAYRIMELYHKKGYIFAQVAPVISSSDNQIDLHFFIYEGTRVRTGEISLIGNTLPEKTLREILVLSEGDIHNSELLDSDRERIQNYYTSLGYLSADIEQFGTIYDEKSNTVDIEIKINEGLKTEIERVDIIGAQHIPEEEIRDVIQIKKGDIYNEADILDARYRIIDLYNTRGLLGTIVTVESEIDKQKANVNFKIEEGTEILFGKTIVSGNYRTKYHVIRRELNDKENMPFDYRILTRDRRNLYKLGLFTDVNMKALDRYDHKKDVLLKLNEGKPGSIELSLGYADYERYRATLDISYRNLWGENKQPSLRLDLSSLSRRLILQYYEPWFLDRQLQFRAFLLTEKKEEINIDTRETRYKLTRYAASAGIEKDISDFLLAKLYYEFSIVKTSDVQPDAILSKEDTGTLFISGIVPSIFYDTRDNLFEPTKGVFTGCSAKFTSPVFLSESNFIKFRFFGNFYHELSKRFVFAASFRGGLATGYSDTDELPIVERFFLGGRTTVRGYEQDMLGPKGQDGNPTGGNAFLMQNLELRTSVWKGIGLVAFLDGGNVWKNVTDIDPKDWKFTTGLGLRYKTPVGPLRIDYGHKLDRVEGESRGEIHFSIGHAF